MKQRPLVPEDLVPPRRGIPLRPDPDAMIAHSVEALTRAAIVTAQAHASHRDDAIALAKERWPDDSWVPLVLRAPISPTGLPNALGASVVQDLLTVVGQTGAGAKLLQMGLSLSFNGAASIYVPGLLTTASAASFVGQGAPIPVHQFLTTSVTLTPFKLASIAPVTVEMLESSNVETIVSNALSRSVGLSLDAVLFDANAADGSRLAGLRYNIAALIPSANPYVHEAMVADLAMLAGAVSDIGGSIAFVCNPARAATIALCATRELPYAVLSSPLIAPADVIAIAVDGLVSAISDVPELDTSNVGAIHTSDTPLPISTPGTPPAVAAPVHSLWQSAMLGIRLRFDVSWALRSPKTLAWLSATKW